MRRAAVSVPSNIAEGYGRGTRAEYLRGARVAYGSNSELETQLLLCQDLHCLSSDDAGSLQRNIHEVELMLNALIKALSLRPSVSEQR
jgi:four helix bundle protein